MGEGSAHQGHRQDLAAEHAPRKERLEQLGGSIQIHVQLWRGCGPGWAGGGGGADGEVRSAPAWAYPSEQSISFAVRGSTQVQ